MDMFRSHRPQSDLLAPPPPRRMSTPAGDRLSTILEGSGSATNVQGDTRRDSGRSWSSKIPVFPQPGLSADTRPPPYSRDWQADGANYPEKRQKGWWRARLRNKRGGWGRVSIIILLLVLLLIALAIGLGVGLGMRHRSKSTDSQGDSQPSEAGASHEFPLGEYTFVTALRDVSTNCSSDATTWRCYPYATYQNDDSTSGLTIFNWVLNNSAPSYVTNSTPPSTGIAGIPANISISSDQNPFSISLTNQSLTFVNDNNNPRYMFSFTYAQSIVPSAPINGDNVASTCIFNQTSFTATLYLSDSQAKRYPGANLQSSSQVNGGFNQWPYAVEVTEYADGGQNVPTCYQTTNGVLGQPLNSLTPQPAYQQCLCKYSNFDV